MDNEENPPPNNPVFAIVVPWLNSLVLTDQVQAGDVLTGHEILDDAPPLRTYPENANRGIVDIFPRMASVHQYERSRQLIEEYNSLQNASQRTTAPEANNSSLSDLDNLSQQNVSFDDSPWLVPTSSEFSNSDELSQTDSEVYESSPSNEDHTRNFNQEPKVDDSGSSKSDDVNSEQIENEPVVNENTSQFEINTIPNILQNNLLLQACILDLNEVPMNPDIALISHQIISLVFNEEERRILRHFIRYRINTAINEITGRIQGLLQQQRETIDQISAIHDVELENSVSNVEEVLTTTDEIAGGDQSRSVDVDISTNCQQSIKQRTRPTRFWQRLCWRSNNVLTSEINERKSNWFYDCWRRLNFRQSR